MSVASLKLLLLIRRRWNFLFPFPNFFLFYFFVVASVMFSRTFDDVLPFFFIFQFCLFVTGFIVFTVFFLLFSLLIFNFLSRVVSWFFSIENFFRLSIVFYHDECRILQSKIHLSLKEKLCSYSVLFYFWQYPLCRNCWCPSWWWIFLIPNFPHILYPFQADGTNRHLPLVFYPFVLELFVCHLYIYHLKHFQCYYM